MIKEIQIRLPVHESEDQDLIKKKAAQILRLNEEEISAVKILRKSIDARKPRIIINYKVAVYTGADSPQKIMYDFDYMNVEGKPKIHIIGFGPAGMFAALRCLELGYQPIVFERGKDVQARRRDLKAINQDHIVNEDSNYCFGEGGAGTYSDGKLYTRSLKRGDVRKVFESFVYHGATEQILIDAHPHIGTNKLPKIVKNIRETILKCGGEVRFNSKLTDLEIKSNRITSIQINKEEEIPIENLILATGHSARDIFYMLHEKSVVMKAKSFAMGIRIEHPQTIIDQIQYHCDGLRDDRLPAAAYSMVHQVKGRGVYSFCMCPGGFIVPAATALKEIVVNGMSPSKRDNRFANSGIVVELDINKDFKRFEDQGELRGLAFQKYLEHHAYLWGGKSQAAPAQRMTDFVEGHESIDLNDTSYQPGLTTVPLHSFLPKVIGSRLRKGLKAFGEKMNGYYTSEANIVGVESRTSSPINIPRSESLKHVEIQNLFPCGEGAGYAGGIVSAAMDGERCAEAVVKAYNS